MADNYLITGYWGEPHVTAENDRGIHAAIFGAGRFVLPVGEQLRAEYVGNNTIRIYDGKLMNNGAAGGIPAGKWVDVLIANAGQGMKRNDLIVFQYEQDSSTLVESGTFVVVQGAETSGTATDPELIQADLLYASTTFDQMPLYRVSVSGATIAAPEKVFTVTGSIGADSIAEQGTSGIWTYRKWTSGLKECWGKYSVKINLNGNSGVSGIVSYTGAITANYPSGLFTTIPDCTATLTQLLGSDSKQYNGWLFSKGVGSAAVTPSFGMFRIGSGVTDLTVDVAFHAIGK